MFKNANVMFIIVEVWTGYMGTFWDPEMITLELSFNLNFILSLESRGTKVDLE